MNSCNNFINSCAQAAKCRRLYVAARGLTVNPQAAERLKNPLLSQILLKQKDIMDANTHACNFPAGNGIRCKPEGIQLQIRKILNINFFDEPGA